MCQVGQCASAFAGAFFLFPHQDLVQREREGVRLHMRDRLLWSLSCSSEGRWRRSGLYFDVPTMRTAEPWCATPQNVPHVWPI